MSRSFKGGFRASPMYAVDLNNRACDLSYQTPSEYTENLTDILWNRSRGFMAMPFDSSAGLWDAEATWWEWPLRDTGARSCKLISGVTRDSNDDPLPNCTVKSYTTVNDVKQETCVSDNTGNFNCPTYATGSHYLVSYKAGAPDIAGTTRNDLTAS